MYRLRRRGSSTSPDSIAERHSPTCEHANRCFLICLRVEGILKCVLSCYERIYVGVERRLDTDLVDLHAMGWFVADMIGSVCFWSSHLSRHAAQVLKRSFVMS